ncbi:MAG: hypothetical protein MUP63_02835 [Candidatus Nanohaloarchaeota archaeon QJJ-7]|nr:hypothetical protein [Candidatus Nanohaloarchaeota archaeon QJJ-7]
MASIGRALSDLVENIIAFFVMIILGILGFYLTVFVVTSGASLAGVSAGGDFVVISAALIVAASIIGGMR